MKRYVVGLYFDWNMETVVLLRKNRPDWQKGLLNGPGGHIREKESCLGAVIREFKEEAGLTFKDWKPLAEYRELNPKTKLPEYVCYFWYASGDLEGVKTVTDEPVLFADIEFLPDNLVENLYWLIPLCCDEHINKPVLFTGTYSREKEDFK